MSFEVKKVSSNQMEVFCSILKEVAVWLKSERQEMWSIEQITTENVLKEYSSAELFLGYSDKIPVATVILREIDELFWPLVAKSESLFLHKLSVKRDFAKRGLGHNMITWAISEARKRNEKYLRLDCAADRPKLCDFYESCGFRKVKEQIMFGIYPTAFYELEVI